MERRTKVLLAIMAAVLTIALVIANVNAEGVQPPPCIRGDLAAQICGRSTLYLPMVVR
jgi:hypothetical protein